MSKSLLFIWKLYSHIRTGSLFLATFMPVRTIHHSSSMICGELLATPYPPKKTLLPPLNIPYYSPLQYKCYLFFSACSLIEAKKSTPFCCWWRSMCILRRLDQPPWLLSNLNSRSKQAVQEGFTLARYCFGYNQRIPAMKYIWCPTCKILHRH